MDFNKEQLLICQRFNSPFVEAGRHLKVGISKNVLEGAWPLNGMRHPLEGDTTGWYIWSGEDFSQAPDFFVPMHVEHLEQICPSVLKYLGLAPGWRFLIAEDYEDVWEDLTLLDI
ncbi:immunity protein Imm33 domain-containing protein [Pedobacter ginsengisoli]|uniref:immunity protein Imm33 domain-containing protein n=1 Tax=Pedobacter ginsengisoli TaxID=363852 RepID=UPI00254CEAF3|nr:hypothetical protein [Pedobacter ginsengisoli]